jgi:RNA polymerase sigma factor (TIGR02999 family)
MRLFSGEPVDWNDSAHFFAVAAQQLRRILVDHARSRRAGKRGGAQVRVTLAEFPGSRETGEDVLAVHEALSQLERLDPRAAKVVELRFFGGLDEKEAANVLGVSLATLKRDWAFARAWLQVQLRGPD